MLESVRAFLSVTCFCIGCYLVVDLFVAGFDGLVLIGAIASFGLAHALWPKQRRSEGNDPLSTLLDWLEVIVELPVRLIALVLRSIGRILRNADFDI